MLRSRSLFWSVNEEDCSVDHDSLIWLNYWCVRIMTWYEEIYGTFSVFTHFLLCNDWNPPIKRFVQVKIKWTPRRPSIKLTKTLGLLIFVFRELNLSIFIWVHISLISHSKSRKSGRAKISILYSEDQLFVKSAHCFDQVNTLYNILQEIWTLWIKFRDSIHPLIY